MWMVDWIVAIWIQILKESGNGAEIGGQDIFDNMIYISTITHEPPFSLSPSMMRVVPIDPPMVLMAPSRDDPRWIVREGLIV